MSDDVDNKAGDVLPLYPEDITEIESHLGEGSNATVWACYGIGKKVGGEPPIGKEAEDWETFSKAVAAEVRAARSAAWADVNLAVEIATLGKSRRQLATEEAEYGMRMASKAKELGLDLSGMISRSGS